MKGFAAFLMVVAMLLFALVITRTVLAACGIWMPSYQEFGALVGCAFIGALAVVAAAALVRAVQDER